MIKIENLFFTYPNNSEPTIKDINFEVHQGEIFGFLGPSGAGKSTLQKLIIRILRNYRGRITIKNRDLKTYGNDLYERIGVSFELPNLYSKFTALENLNYFRALYNHQTTEPIELLKLVDLEKDANTRVSEFSKGMKMRLNFCRSLLPNPEILFLDEPTSGLDPVNARNIRDIIREQKSKGTTIFLTTHNMNVAEEICDRVAFIVDGQIKLIDSPHELKLRAGKQTVRIEYLEGSKPLTKEFPLNQLGTDPDFLEIIRTKELRTIHTQEATLEDIFIKITGRSLQ